MINVRDLLLGCFLDVSTLLLVITPLRIPTAAGIGRDPHQFGIVIVFNAIVGLVTPPRGILLFLIEGPEDVPLSEMIRGIWLFIALF